MTELWIMIGLAVLAGVGLWLVGMWPYWKWEKRINKQIKEIREQNKLERLKDKEAK